MLKGGVSCEDRVVRLDDRVGQGGCRVNAEFQLGLLAVVGRETLEDESTETRSSSTSERVEDKEALQTRAVVCETADLVHHYVNLFFSDGVVTTSICEKKKKVRKGLHVLRL